MPRKMWLLPVAVVVTTLLSLLAILLAGPLLAGGVIVWCEGAPGNHAFVDFHPTDQLGNGISGNSYTIPSFPDPEGGYIHKTAYWSVHPIWNCPNSVVVESYIEVSPYVVKTIYGFGITCNKNNGCFRTYMN